MTEAIAAARDVAALQAASTRQILQGQFVRQEADAEQALADMLLESAAQATLPAGQGVTLDITA